MDERMQIIAPEKKKRHFLTKSQHYSLCTWCSAYAERAYSGVLGERIEAFTP